MLKDIQDWFPIKSYRGRISALILFVLSLLGYYLWLYPFLETFDEQYYYMRIYGQDDERKIALFITVPKYIYSSETRDVSVDIENRTNETIRKSSLQIVLGNDYGNRALIKSNSIIAFENIQPHVRVSGKIPLSISGLNDGDRVELNFLYIEDNQTQIIHPDWRTEVQLNRWKGLSNSILEKMFFPPFSLAFIFTIVLISCSLFEDKNEEEQPILSKSGIKQTARVFLLGGGATFLISGIIIGFVTQWHLISLAMIYLGLIFTSLTPKKAVKNNVARKAKIIVSANGDEKEVELE